MSAPGAPVMLHSSTIVSPNSTVSSRGMTSTKIRSSSSSVSRRKRWLVASSRGFAIIVASIARASSTYRAQRDLGAATGAFFTASLAMPPNSGASSSRGRRRPPRLPSARTSSASMRRTLSSTVTTAWKPGRLTEPSDLKRMVSCVPELTKSPGSDEPHTLVAGAAPLLGSTSPSQISTQSYAHVDDDSRSNRVYERRSTRLLGACTCHTQLELSG
mmetsp:Transcript_23238/g.80963  ORF Transcript_23238/g.80963 Transcript_23238/m.80963 type:complete len:216 (+) Transcript_23238:9573-10220(+)